MKYLLHLFVNQSLTTIEIKINGISSKVLSKVKEVKKMSNITGATHKKSLQGSYWADQNDSHNKVIMTSLQGQ